jgi:hypothetical protein
LKLVVEESHSKCYTHLNESSIVQLEEES